MEENIFGLIRTKYNTMSPAQKNIADYILSNPEKVILYTISDLAHKCDTSETTIMRFLRKLNYDSYQVFRVKIAQEISAESETAVYEEVSEDDSISSIKKKVIQLTINSINDLNNILDDKSLINFTQKIKEVKRIVFIGIGASSMIAEDAHHKFVRLGLDASFCRDSHIMSIICAHLNKDDMVVAVSHSGESREILDAIELAKKNDCQIVAITSYSKSSLAKKANIVLLSSTRETEYRSDAMISRIVQLVIIDTLYVQTVLSMGTSGIKTVNESRLAVAKKKT